MASESLRTDQSGQSQSAGASIWLTFLIVVGICLIPVSFLAGKAAVVVTAQPTPPSLVGDVESALQSGDGEEMARLLDRSETIPSSSGVTDTSVSWNDSDGDGASATINWTANGTKSSTNVSVYRTTSSSGLFPKWSVSVGLPNIYISSAVYTGGEYGSTLNSSSKDQMVEIDGTQFRGDESVTVMPGGHKVVAVSSDANLISGSIQPSTIVADGQSAATVYPRYQLTSTGLAQAKAATSALLKKCAKGASPCIGENDNWVSPGPVPNRVRAIATGATTAVAWLEDVRYQDTSTSAALAYTQDYSTEIKLLIHDGKFIVPAAQ